MARRRQAWVLFVALIGASLPALGRVEVFACEPEWAALAEEIGGETVSVFSATTARQDPHYIEARPSLIAKARRAQLMVCTGAGLEAGWLPMVVRQAGNPGLRPGQPGYLEAAEHVPLQGIPETVDRSQGDIHPQGNPHLHLDPRNLARVAAVLAQRLAVLDPKRAAHYRARLDAFERRWQAAVAQWEAAARPLQGMAVVVHHDSWRYLEGWLGLERRGTLEPKPGLAPTSAHLATLLRGLQSRPASAILLGPYHNPKPARWLSAKTGMPVVTLPYTVGGTEGAADLFGLFADTVDRLLALRP